MKVIIWDWDNTLADTFSAFHKTYLTLLKRRKSRKKWTEADTWTQLNCPSVEALYHFSPKEDQEKLCQEFFECYEHFAKKISLLPHATQALKWAQKNGFTNILVSNKFIDTLSDAVEQYKLSPYFYQVYGDGSLTLRKNDKGYARLLKKEYPNATEIFVIGDGFVDMKLGMALKATNILVVRPHAPKLDKSIKVDYKIHDLAEIKKILG